MTWQGGTVEDGGGHVKRLIQRGSTVIWVSWKQNNAIALPCQEGDYYHITTYFSHRTPPNLPLTGEASRLPPCQGGIEGGWFKVLQGYYVLCVAISTLPKQLRLPDSIYAWRLSDVLQLPEQGKTSSPSCFV